MRRNPRAAIWIGNVKNVIITIGVNAHFAEEKRIRGGMSMEVYERKEMAALFGDWKLILEKAEKIAERMEALFDRAYPEDDAGPDFGYCAYCYKENCDRCISRRRADGKGGR